MGMTPFESSNCVEKNEVKPSSLVQFENDNNGNSCNKYPDKYEQITTSHLLSVLECNNTQTSKGIDLYSDTSRLSSSHFNGERLMSYSN